MPRKPRQVILPGRDTSTSLDLKQIRALSWRLLCPEASQREVAVYAGCDEATVRRWLRQPTFAHLWDDAQAAHVAVVTTAVARGERDAYATLQAVMDDPDASHGTRVDAAKAVLMDVARRRQAQHGRQGPTIVALVEAWAREAEGDAALPALPAPTHTDDAED